MATLLSFVKSTVGNSEGTGTKWYRKLLCLREQLIESRTTIFATDPTLYAEYTMQDLAVKLHYDMFEYVQSEIEDIDELLYDATYPEPYTKVNEDEYITELRASGLALAAFLRSHRDLRGEYDDGIKNIIEIEASISNELLSR